MTAIDISRYQGAVDFNAVKAAGVGVVIAKMGGGDAGPYVDANWSTNRNGIRAAGLKLGSYYFNGPGQSPIAAADYQFQNIDYRPGDLVIIDVEGGAIAWSVSQVIEWTNQMLAHGVPASSIGVYMSASVVNNYNWGPVAALGTFLWVASYGANTGQPGTPPTVIHWPGWTLWQYTSNGSIAGVPGRVDVSQIAPSFAGGTVTALINTEEEMARIFVVTDGPELNVTYLLAGGRLTLIQPLDTIALNSATAVVLATNGGNDPGYYTVSGQQIVYIKGLLGFGAAPVQSAAVDLSPILAAIAAAVDLAPVLTQLAALEATLTKGYTFNVKPAA